MRVVTIAALLLGMTLLTTSGATSADDDLVITSNVDIGLLVHTDFAGTAGSTPGEPDELVGTASCTVSVPGGSDAGDVLDQAVTDGCILEWDHDEYDGARFVTSIDGLRSVGLTCIAWPVVCQWWEFRVNDNPVGFGIDDYSAETGDTVEFFFHTA